MSVEYLWRNEGRLSMLFIEWSIIGRLCSGLLLVILAGVGFWLVRKRKLPVRLSVRLLSLLIGLWGALNLWGTWFGVAAGHIYSAPTYSPNKKIAARIDHYNADEIGGPTYDAVEIFSHKGLRSSIVFSGEWKSMDVADLRWTSDSDLEIHYRGAAFFCRNALVARVHCFGR